MSFIGSVAKTVMVHIVADYLTEPTKKIIDVAVTEGNKLKRKFDAYQASKKAKETPKPPTPVTITINTDTEEAHELSPGQQEMNKLRDSKRHRKV